MKIKRILVYLAIIAICVVWLLPLIGLGFSSLKPSEEIKGYKISYRGKGALKLNYDRGSTWVGYQTYTTPNKTGYDVSEYSYASVWVKGTEGNEEFKVGLRDTSDNVSYVYLSSLENFGILTPGSWEEVKFPLSSFTEVTMENIKQIEIIFDSEPRTGSIYFDDLIFKTSLGENELIVARFDNKAGTNKLGGISETIDPNPEDPSETINSVYEQNVPPSGPLSPPDGVYTSNYENALFEEGSPPLATAFKNSAIIVVFALALSIFIGSLAAYPLARLNFRGNFLFYMLFVFAMMLPFQLVMIPVHEAGMALGIYNTLLAVVLAHVVFGVPFCAFILRNFFKSIPQSLQDAARVDGCSHFTFYWKVILPLALPALAVLALLQFTGIYNDMLWALVLLGRVDLLPVPNAILSFMDIVGKDPGIFTAAVFLAVIPTLVLFIFLQRYFLKGLKVAE